MKETEEMQNANFAEEGERDRHTTNKRPTAKNDLDVSSKQEDTETRDIKKNKKTHFFPQRTWNTPYTLSNRQFELISVVSRKGDGKKASRVLSSHNQR